MSSPETPSFPKEDSALGQALALMKTALVLLDEADAPPHIGAHLDLAICQLGEIVNLDPPIEPLPPQPTD